MFLRYFIPIRPSVSARIIHAAPKNKLFIFKTIKKAFIFYPDFSNKQFFQILRRFVERFFTSIGYVVHPFVG
ncbi:hypothetical protein JW935_27780, partial [candidate division KSB1 bacterium]|nr:hypothetical protein [candidate division KSB1 bacterium]